MMKFLCGMLVLLPLLAMIPAEAAEKAIWRKEKLTYQGMPREYWVYVPASARVKDARPALVLMLHGGGGRADRFDALVKNRLKPLADRDGAILVYPQAYKRQWNDGRGVASIPAHVENIDDVGFIDALIRKMEGAYPIDPRRIYAGGISNGGMMSARLACELSGKIAAVALVASAIPERLTRRCQPSSPVSMLMISGTDDPLVPFAGGQVRVGRQDRGAVLSASESALYWAGQLGFNRDLHPVRRTVLPEMNPGDGTRVTKTIYPGSDGSVVVLYVIEGGGHTWPQGQPYLPAWIVGRVSQELDGTQAVWTFFQGQPRP